MGRWSFLTNHARALLCIAHDPGVRLRDIAAMVGVTERSAHDMVTDLVDAGYVVKDKEGRRNRYRIQEHVPLRDPISQEPTIGEMLDLLVGVNAHRNPHNQDGIHDGRHVTPQTQRQETQARHSKRNEQPRSSPASAGAGPARSRRRTSAISDTTGRLLVWRPTAPAKDGLVPTLV